MLGSSDRWENYHALALLLQASKILTKIVHCRIGRETEDHLTKNWFAFRKKPVIKEEILKLWILKKHNKAKPTYVASVQKAFGTIKLSHLFEILKDIGFKFRDRWAILVLYKLQKVVIHRR